MYRNASNGCIFVIGLQTYKYFDLILILYRSISGPVIFDREIFLEPNNNLKQKKCGCERVKNLIIIK